MHLGIVELLIILAIVILVFGTGRLRNLGSDLGGAIRGLRRALTGKTDGASPTTKTSAR